ncbi:uncharacterized protein LOC133815502 [Humulus lupulus]|uniref:uncharacterized protein LOC133815502 n=1 Tax=Humulus lupulus TaxID=3486 RepID=UPI002B40FF4A|nr:uncharacterized protein LOC133815502 [Humulus lupulus]
MSTKDMFELYNVPVPTAPSSKKKGSRQHRGETNQNPPTKKARTGDPPTPVHSKETTPPPTPLDQTSPPAPTDQISPPAPADQIAPSADQASPAAPAGQAPPAAPTGQAPPDQTRDALMSIVLSSAKERMTKILRHRRNQEAITGTDSMEVDQIINCALNEKGILTMIASWRRLGAQTAQYEKKLGEQLKASEERHAEELRVDEEKYKEQLEVAKNFVAMSLQRSARTNGNASNAALINNEAPPVRRRGVRAAASRTAPLTSPVDNIAEIARLRQIVEELFQQQ